MKLCLLKKKVVLIKDLTPKTVFLDVSSQNAVYKRGRGGNAFFFVFFFIPIKSCASTKKSEGVFLASLFSCVRKSTACIFWAYSSAVSLCDEQDSISFVHLLQEVALFRSFR